MKREALGLAALLTWPMAALAHDAPPCRVITHDEVDYTVCKFDPTKADIRLFLNDADGEPLGSFDAVNAKLAKTDERLVFGMNGGMYHSDRKPVGGYTELKKQVSPINTNKGPGNFHMLPNGVFWITQTNEDYEDPPEVYYDAYVGSTESYQEGAHFVRDMTQSGPMLVIDNKLHPKFNKGSDSRKIRNGVGRDESGQLFFVKSETPVNFHSFATLFKDELKTPNALYLDGAISRLFAENLDRNDFGAPMGPIIGVVEKTQTAKAKYIANEAVLITQGDTKIMFDPLPLSGFGVYAEPSFAEITDMMTGVGEYNGVDVVFISHAHRDHFFASRMIEYLNAQPRVTLVAPKQALDAMMAEPTWDHALRLRMNVLDMEAGDKPQTFAIGDVTATALRIPHAGWPAPKRASVQNMIYRVTLDEGVTVIHMGDADPNRQHFTPHKTHWAGTRTDTAFPPYWFLTSEEGRSILTNDMNVAASIGIHVPVNVPEDLKASGQDYFSVGGETRDIVKEHTHD